MRRMLVLAALAWTLMAGTLAYGAMVADVAIPETAEVGGVALRLNGAGLRTKFGFKVYAGALYLPSGAAEAEAAITMQGPKRVLLHFIYKKLEREKLVEAWQEGFEKNLPEAGLKALGARIEAFCAAFGDTARGETYQFDYVPSEGTRVFRNGELKATIEGEDFMRGLLLIWLGPEPAHEKLKRAMLGQ